MSAIKTSETPAIDDPARTTWRLVMILLAAGVAGAATVAFGHGYSGGDIDVYRGAGATVLHGRSLYDFTGSVVVPALHFTYTPFTAILLAPLGLLPMNVTTALWAALSVFALEAVVWMLVGRTAARRTLLTAAGTTIAITLAPVSSNLWAGQINILLMLLVVADLTRARGRLRGISTGIAAGIKLTPLIFIPYLFLSRQIRAGFTATGTFVATILVGAVVLPGASGRFWFNELFDIKNVVPLDQGWTFDQTILGTLKRIPGSPDELWLVFALPIGIAGVLVAAWACVRGHEAAGMVACAMTGLLISPVSWPFHWVWCVPALILWARRAWLENRTAEKAGLVAVCLALAAMSYWWTGMFFSWPVPTPLHVVFANLFSPIALLMLIAFAVHLRREAARGGTGFMAEVIRPFLAAWRRRPG